jgi:hypothetical protein
MHTEGNTQLSSAYTIKAARKKDGYGCFEVEEKSQITSRAFYSFGDLSVITDGTGTVAGKWVFDYDRGLIHYYEARAKMDTQSIPVGGTNANPIASTLTATTKRELKAIE